MPAARLAAAGLESTRWSRLVRAVDVVVRRGREVADHLGLVVERHGPAIDVEAAADSLPTAAAADCEVERDQRVGDGRGGSVRAVNTATEALAPPAPPRATLAAIRLLASGQRPGNRLNDGTHTLKGRNTVLDH